MKNRETENALAMELLEKVATTLLDATELIDKLANTHFIRESAVWSERLPKMGTETGGYAYDLSELYGLACIYNKRERSAL